MSSITYPAVPVLDHDAALAAATANNVVVVRLEVRHAVTGTCFHTFVILTVLTCPSLFLDIHTRYSGNRL